MATEITAKLVSDLRAMTGAGMMECKKALVEANGDIDAAVDVLRKAGLAKVGKKADRQTAEGSINTALSEDKKEGALVEINCETDFVARGDDFKAFAEAVARTALKSKSQQIESLMNAILHNSDVSVESARAALVAKIGENIQIRRIAYMKSGGGIGAYVHGNRIGVLVNVHGGDETLHKDLAMHIAASNPLVISPNDAPQELVAKEKEIFTAQALDSGKPPEIIEKMIGGRIKKYLDEISLLGQPFVKDPDTSVGTLLQRSKARVDEFIRFEVGEGIEKKTGNFVEEVMAQVRSS